MNIKRWAVRCEDQQALPRAGVRNAFTLIEILVVVAIIGILVGLMGAVVTNSIRKAREAATIATILKIDGLLDERLKGFERATKSRDFQRVVEAFTNQLLQQSEDINGNGTLDAGEDLNGNGTIDRGVLRLHPKVIAAVARKEFLRQYFPQRFNDLPPNSPYFEPPPPARPVLPTVIQNDPQVGSSWIEANHQRRTESSELLYYALTRMHVFGVPPVGESEFGTNEVRDTDGDGLLEFVDGWGRPLRFYRWPTRLLKPNGPYGSNGVPSGGDFATYGQLGSDDVVIPQNMRNLAGLLIEGLVAGPVVPGQWDTLSEDPDDPYGIITTELKRQFASNIHAYPVYPVGSPTSSARFEEPFYPTLDTYHTPLIVSVGPDGSRPGFQDNGLDSDIEMGLGLFEPWEGADANGDGIFDSDLGVLAQPRHGPGGPYDVDSYISAIGGTPFDRLSDNITNRNRRAGGRR